MNIQPLSYRDNRYGRIVVIPDQTAPQEMKVDIQETIAQQPLPVNNASAGTGEYFLSGRETYWSALAPQLPFRFYNSPSPFPMPAHAHSVPSGHRATEMEWRRTHKEFLRTLVGQWVVLEGDVLIAYGMNLAQLVTEARAKGIRVPYVFYVEEMAEDVIRIGL